MMEVGLLTSGLVPQTLYTDPGSGLLAWQLLTGALVGVAFYWRRMFTWLKSKLRG